MEKIIEKEQNRNQNSEEVNEYAAKENINGSYKASSALL